MAQVESFRVRNNCEVAFIERADGAGDMGEHEEKEEDEEEDSGCSCGCCNSDREN